MVPPAPIAASIAAPIAAPLGGDAEPRFERVREAFAANFEDEDEIGAGLCVRVGGHVVVDLWGGFCDAARTRSWQRDTLVNAYSVGKGVTAMLLLSAVESGALDLDDPVSRHWPEFGCEGKEEVTVRELASHQAGLPAVRETLARDAWSEWSTMCGALAGQRPYWRPGSAHGYHTNTFGFLLGEVIRRATGEAVGPMLARVMAALEVDGFWFGLPRELHGRVSDLVAPQADLTTPEQWALAFPPTGDEAHDQMVWHCYFNPSGLSGLGTVNSAAWREAVVPSTNGHATGRGVAALYDAMLGRSPQGMAWASRSLRDDAIRVHVDGPDRVLGRPSRFGVGFQVTGPDRPLGRGERSFGHYGYGGSLGFADADADLAFGYVMNRPGDRWQTPRTQRLVDAVYDCLG